MQLYCMINEKNKADMELIATNLEEIRGCSDSKGMKAKKRVLYKKYQL